MRKIERRDRGELLSASPPVQPQPPRRAVAPTADYHTQVNRWLACGNPAPAACSADTSSSAWRGSDSSPWARWPKRFYQ